jgi:hypothetical protein
MISAGFIRKFDPPQFAQRLLVQALKLVLWAKTHDADDIVGSG